MHLADVATTVKNCASEVKCVSSSALFQKKKLCEMQFALLIS